MREPVVMLKKLFGLSSGLSFGLSSGLSSRLSSGLSFGCLFEFEIGFENSTKKYKSSCHITFMSILRLLSVQTTYLSLSNFKTSTNFFLSFNFFKKKST